MLQRRTASSCEGLYQSSSEVQKIRWGILFFYFVHPNCFDHFLPLEHLPVEVKASLSRTGRDQSRTRDKLRDEPFTPRTDHGLDHLDHFSQIRKGCAQDLQEIIHPPGGTCADHADHTDPIQLTCAVQADHTDCTF